MRFWGSSLVANAVKLWAKKPCRRSRAMMPGSIVMPSRAAAIVARETPFAAASWRNSASHRSKLPVLRQLLLGGGYLLGSAAAAGPALSHVDTIAIAASFAVAARIIGSLLGGGKVEVLTDVFARVS